MAKKYNITAATDGKNLMGQIDLQRKDVMIRGALRLFHERGYHNVTMVDIAKLAGVTRNNMEYYFSSKEEVCHKVIDIYLESQTALFKDISDNNNPRQRLSLYLDSIEENAGSLTSKGCPLTNLYYDVWRQDDDLAERATELLRQRLDWITEQFILILRVEGITDLPDRLASAIHGISILAQVTGDQRMIRTQINQLKSWIRSM